MEKTMSYKTLLAYLLTVMVGLSMTACPDDSCDDDLLGGTDLLGGATGGAEDCEEGGAIGGETGGAIGGAMGGDMGGATGGAETVYNTLIILDETTDVNDDGTPGVDICEIEVTCNDEPAIENDYVGYLGSDECNGENGENCVCIEPVEPTCTSGIDRGDFSLAFDGATCDADGDNYVSLGQDGDIEATYDVNLLGCSVKVYEKGGRNTEGYSVFACPADYESLEDCIEVGGFVSSNEEISAETFEIELAE
jgi:hypothetical protein